MRIKNFFNFKKIHNEKQKFIESFLGLDNDSFISLHFRSIDTHNVLKCNTEDEIVDLLEKGQIFFHGCHFKSNIDFISEVKLTHMIEKLIMGDEYRNKVSQSNIKHFSTGKWQYKSTYYFKVFKESALRLEKFIIDLEQIGVSSSKIKINQEYSDVYWPYIDFIIKVDNSIISKIIDIIWDDKLEFPKISQLSDR